MHYWMDVGFIRPVQRDGKKKDKHKLCSCCSSPTWKYCFCFWCLIGFVAWEASWWTSRAGGGEDGALGSHRSDFRGNIDRWYGSTESDPEGYPSVNNDSGGEELHLWITDEPSSPQAKICTTALSQQSVCVCVCVCACVCACVLRNTTTMGSSHICSQMTENTEKLERLPWLLLPDVPLVFLFHAFSSLSVYIAHLCSGE